MMGATIIVDDDSDAVFSLTLRLAINAAHPGNELTTPSHRLALVAVDDPVVRAILDELLRSSGVLPLHAAPGVSLADVVKRHAPDLLILECPASPQDAIALVTSLRATTGLPLLLLGPAPSEGTCRLPLGTGPTELAALPLAPDEFLEKAHRLLLRTDLRTNAPGPSAPRAA